MREKEHPPFAGTAIAQDCLGERAARHTPRNPRFPGLTPIHGDVWNLVPKFGVWIPAQVWC